MLDEAINFIINLKNTINQKYICIIKEVNILWCKPRNFYKIGN